MRDGFIKVAAGTPRIRVADCHYNAEQIFTMMREADQQGVRVLCLPELCLTGYTCGDLFLQDTLLRGAEEGLNTILEATRNLDLVTAVGLVPERELLRSLGEQTPGWVSLCGNCDYVHEIVDAVTAQAEALGASMGERENGRS